MEDIAQSNYCLRQTRKTLEVKLFSRTAALHIPEDVSELLVHAEWMNLEREVLLCQGASDLNGFTQSEGSRHVYSVCPGSEVIITIQKKSLVNRAEKRFPSTPLIAIGRRVASEIRDRSMPWLPRALVKRG